VARPALPFPLPGRAKDHGRSLVRPAVLRPQAAAGFSLKGGGGRWRRLIAHERPPFAARSTPANRPTRASSRNSILSPDAARRRRQGLHCRRFSYVPSVAPKFVGSGLFVTVTQIHGGASLNACCATTSPRAVTIGGPSGSVRSIEMYVSYLFELNKLAGTSITSENSIGLQITPEARGS
jgi:hypothetical protein